MEVLEESKICEAVATIWATMFGLDVSSKSCMSSNTSGAGNMIGSIQISGSWKWIVRLECPGGLVRQCAAIIFGMNVRDLTRDEIDDALAEVTNILGGRMKAFLPEPSQLSIPVVTEVNEITHHEPKSNLMSVKRFSCEGHPFEVKIWTENTDPSKVGS